MKKNIAIALVLSLAVLTNGCGASAGFQATSTVVTASYESPASICDRFPAHMTRRVHRPIVVNGVSYFCF